MGCCQHITCGSPQACAYICIGYCPAKSSVSKQALHVHAYIRPDPPLCCPVACSGGVVTDPNGAITADQAIAGQQAILNPTLTAPQVQIASSVWMYRWCRVHVAQVSCLLQALPWTQKQTETVVMLVSVFHAESFVNSSQVLTSAHLRSHSIFPQFH